MKKYSLWADICLLLRLYLEELEKERRERAPSKTTSAWVDY
jgi:hypothetical protein